MLSDVCGTNCLTKLNVGLSPSEASSQQSVFINVLTGLKICFLSVRQYVLLLVTIFRAHLRLVWHSTTASRCCIRFRGNL